MVFDYEFMKSSKPVWNPPQTSSTAGIAAIFVHGDTRTHQNSFQSLLTAPTACNTQLICSFETLSLKNNLWWCKSSSWTWNHHKSDSACVVHLTAACNFSLSQQTVFFYADNTSYHRFLEKYLYILLFLQVIASEMQPKNPVSHVISFFTHISVYVLVLTLPRNKLIGLCIIQGQKLLCNHDKTTILWWNFSLKSSVAEEI